MFRTLTFLLWLFGATATFGVANLPLGIEAQLALAVGALAAMLALKLFNIRGPFRPVFLALGTFVILRYLFWRLASTIPSVGSPLDFAAGVVLLLAEIYCISMLFMSLFTVADPIERPKAPRVADEDAPAVDVFVPTYNEAIEIVAPTLAAAKRINYPAGKLNVFLLDDGGTEEKLQSDDAATARRALNRRESLQALCGELGVHYLAREENKHAKAGNLNFGLAHSQGDLVAVFDADHVPAQDFLTETVGFFGQDEKLFLVQTPHFFLNPDPIERNIAAARMPAENEMFYGLVQKGLDKWNAAFFCGSAAVLRRQALEEVGGFHGSSVTEDAETALELHAHGWNSVYVQKPLIAGLQPETFESFIGQRSRWARGMAQILLLKNPLFVPGLKLAQRVCYLSSSLFWLFPLSRMVFIFAPLMYIFFDMKIYIANGQEFIAYTLTYMLSALLIQSYVFGRVRWPWTSDLYEYVQAVKLFPAVIGVFLDPRRPKFNVTAKGQTLDENQLSSLAWPYFALFALVAISMVAIGLKFVNEPDARDLISVVGVWSAFNLCLTGVALGVVSERRERRSAPRVASNRVASLAFGPQTASVAIEDMSFGGLRVRVLDGTKLPAKGAGVLRVESGDDGAQGLETPIIIAGRRVNDDGRGVGLKFYGVSADRFKIISKVMFSTIDPIYAGRSEKYLHFGVLRGSLNFAVAALNQTFRGLYYVFFRRGQVIAPSAARSSESSAS
jgi:cellulose synthase (UDP-forming)